MNVFKAKIDRFDLKILTELQGNRAPSQRELADAVGLSHSACWRRLRRLQERGIIKGVGRAIDLAALWV